MEKFNSDSEIIFLDKRTNYNDEVNMAYISYEHLRNYLNDRCVLPPALNKGDLCSFIKSLNLQQDRSILIPLNLNSHWIALAFLIKNNSIYAFYIDSLGEEGCKSDRLEIEKIIKDNFSKIEIKFNLIKQQFDNSSCGVFALNNLKFLAEKFSKLVDSQSNLQKLMYDFERSDFTSQREANYLKEKIFPLLKNVSQIRETKVKEEIRKFHYDDIVNIKQIIDKANYFFNKNISIEILNPSEIFLKSNSKNSITINLIISKLLPQEYHYDFIFILSDDLESQTIFNELKHIFKRRIYWQDTNIIIKSEGRKKLNLNTINHPSHIEEEFIIDTTKEVNAPYNNNVNQQNIKNQFFNNDDKLKIIYQSIKELDYQKIKLLIKEGVKLNDRVEVYINTHSHLLDLLEIEKNNKLDSESLKKIKKIERLFKQHGCVTTSKESKELLSDKTDEENLERFRMRKFKLVSSHDNPYKEFYKNLKECMYSSLVFFSDVSFNKDSLAKNIIEFTTGKIPYIGSILKGIFLGLIQKMDLILMKEIKTAVNHLNQNNVIRQYVMNVIEHNFDIITTKFNLGLMNEIKCKAESKLKQYTLNRSEEEIIINNEGYAMMWSLLIHKFIKKFYKFLLKKESVGYYGKNELGAFIINQNYNKYLITPEEYSRLAKDKMIAAKFAIYAEIVGLPAYKYREIILGSNKNRNDHSIISIKEVLIDKSSNMDNISIYQEINHIHPLTKYNSLFVITPARIIFLHCCISKFFNKFDPEEFMVNSVYRDLKDNVTGIKKIIEIHLNKTEKEIIFISNRDGKNFIEYLYKNNRYVKALKKRIIYWEFTSAKKFYQEEKDKEKLTEITRIDIDTFKDQFKNQEGFLMLKAIKEENFDLLKEYIEEKKFDPNSHLRDYLPIIYEILIFMVKEIGKVNKKFKNLIDIIKYIISKGAKLNSIEKDQLVIILDQKILELVNDVVFEEEFNILLHVCLKKELNMLKYLVNERKYNINMLVGKQFGVIEGNDTVLANVLRSMIKEQVTPNEYKEYFLIVEFLVDNGADLNSYKNLSSHSILHDVYRKGDLNLVKYLISKGANPLYIPKLFSFFTLTNCYDYINAYQSNNLELIKYLIEEKGADVNARDFDYNDSALHFNIANKDTIGYLLSKGADFNIVAKRNETNRLYGGKPLNLAAYYCLIDIMKILIRNNADMHYSDRNCEPPIFSACQSASFSAVKLLMDYGINMESSYKNIKAIDALKSYQPINQFWFYHYKYNVYLFNFIIELKNQRLTLENMKDMINSVRDQNGSLFYFSAYIMSEIIQMEIEIEQKIFKRQIPNDGGLFDYLKSFYEPRDNESSEYLNLILYNKCMKLYMGTEIGNLEKCLQLLDSIKYDEDLSREEILFYKGVIHSNIIMSNLTSEIDKLKNLDKLKEIVSSLDSEYAKLYLRSEIIICERNYGAALEMLDRIINKFPLSYHSIARKIEILIKLNRNEEALKLYESHNIDVDHQFPEANTMVLNKLVLPNDILNIIEESLYALQTNNFLKDELPKLNQTTSIMKGIKKAFTYNIKFLSEYLLSKLPGGFLKVTKYNQFLRGLKFAYNYFCKKQIKKLCAEENLKRIQPFASDHPFFRNLQLECLDKLKEIIIRIDNTTDLSDYSADEEKEHCIEKLKMIIEYYEDYIENVIKDCRSNSLVADYTKIFFESSGRLLDVNENIEVITENEERFFLTKKASAIIKTEGPETELDYGSHKLAIYPTDNNYDENKIFYKFMPHAPGIEYAVHCIYEEIVPNSTPEILLIKLKEKRRSGIYIASRQVFGKNFNEVLSQKEILDKIDPDNFSGLFIGSLLVCPGDSKPDNFILEFEYDKRGLKRTFLRSIDNDIAFCRTKLEINQLNNKIYSDMRNVLYFMQQMYNPVSTNVRNSLLNKDPELTVANWLHKLHKQNLSYEKIFTEEEKIRFMLPIKLPEKTAATMYSILRKLTRFLKNPQITHQDLFDIFYPSISKYYKQLRDNTNLRNCIKLVYSLSNFDPNLINTFLASNRAHSTMAWRTISNNIRTSSIKREVFISTIENEAKLFLANVDFSSEHLNKDKKLNLIDEIGKKLNFLKEMTLSHISPRQLEYLCRNNNTLKSILLKYPLNEEECIKYLKRRKIKFEISRDVENYNILPIQIPDIDINKNLKSIWNIFDLNLDQLTLNEYFSFATILYKNKIFINEVNEHGETALHMSVKLFDSVGRFSHDKEKIKRIIEILLYCGIDQNLTNSEAKTAEEISTSEEIKLLIIQKVPEYLWQVLKDEKLLPRLEFIINTISSQDLNCFVQDEILGREKSPLEYVLEYAYRNKDHFSQDQESINLVKILLARTNLLNDSAIVKYIVEIFSDKNSYLLDEVLKKLDKNESSSIYAEELSQSLLTTLKLRKYQMLAKLLNAGAIFSEDLKDMNLTIISKAAKWGFPISSSDIENQFNYDKIRKDDESTIFHLININKENKILEYYRDKLKKYSNKQNKNQKTPLEIALKNKYVEYLEMFYENENLLDEGNYHLLIDKDNSKLREISKYLKEDLKLDITIAEAINQNININDMYDQKGNSVFYKYFKRIIIETEKEKVLLDHMELILNYFANIDFTNTKRRDGDCVLHLVAKNGSKKLASICLSRVKEDVYFSDLRNAKGLTPIDYAVMFGHEEAANWFRTRKVC